MRVELKSPGPLETKAFPEGTISVEPQFYGNGLEASVAILRVSSDDGTLVRTYLLRVNGRQGNLRLVDYSQPAPARLDRKSTPRASEEKGKANDVGRNRT